MTTWTVPATVLRVVDADTFHLLLDLGWAISLKARARLAHINAPELATDAGKAARDYAVNALPVGVTVMFTSHCLDKYGRPLGAITMPDGRDYAEVLLAAGHAVAYEGGPR